jgi:hypothetical protein
MAPVPRTTVVVGAAMAVKRRRRIRGVVGVRLLLLLHGRPRVLPAAVRVPAAGSGEQLVGPGGVVVAAVLASLLLHAVVEEQRGGVGGLVLVLLGLLLLAGEGGEDEVDLLAGGLVQALAQLVRVGGGHQHQLALALERRLVPRLDAFRSFMAKSRTHAGTFICHCQQELRTSCNDEAVVVVLVPWSRVMSLAAARILSMQPSQLQCIATLSTNARALISCFLSSLVFFFPIFPDRPVVLSC